LALRLGSEATNRMISGYRGEMAGIDSNLIKSSPLTYVLSTERHMDAAKLWLAETMAQ